MTGMWPTCSTEVTCFELHLDHDILSPMALEEGRISTRSTEGLVKKQTHTSDGPPRSSTNEDQDTLQHSQPHTRMVL